MTPTELITEINKLPRTDWEAIKEMVEGGAKNGNSESSHDNMPVVTEREFHERLLADGIISHIPDTDAYTDEDDDFEPLDIPGRRTSELIIEDRR